MPIDYTLDIEKRLVLARVLGTFTRDDLLAYRRSLHERVETRGFNELVDMTAVEHVEWGGALKVRTLAGEAAEMDSEIPTKFAIVAASELTIKVAQMYKAFRETHPRNTRDVQVFPTAEAALAWLRTS
jgi:hypothetical protein